MKAISLRAPWWWALLHCGMRVINRQWYSLPEYEGPLLVHASVFTPQWQEDLVWMRSNDLVPEDAPALTADLVARSTGQFIARARLIGAAWNRDPIGPRHVDMSRIKAPWCQRGVVGLVVVEAEPMPPVPGSGAMGLFNVDDAALAAAIAARCAGQQPVSIRPCADADGRWETR